MKFLNKLSKRNRILILALSVVVLIFLITVIVTTIQCNDYRGAYVGMSYDAFTELMPETEYFTYSPYIFYTNSTGHYVVAHMSRDLEINEIKCFNKLFTNKSPLAFKTIKKGDHIYDVVAKVGIPFDSFTSGMETCAFKASNGSIYTIYWRSMDTESAYEYVVSSVKAHD